MEVLKYYIDTDTYSNVITVNKEWYALLHDMRGPIIFQTLMKRYGWIDYYHKHKPLIESLTPLEIIDCMLETIDDTKPYLFKKDAEYYRLRNNNIRNFTLDIYIKIKINPTLNGLNLMTTNKKI